MIIDTHLHEGAAGFFNLSLSKLLEQMALNGIDGGIVSTVACSEYDAVTGEPFDTPVTQLGENRRLLERIRREAKQLKLAFWCRPSREECSGVADFIRENRRDAVALKLHPFYSRLAIGDRRYEPYFDIARELGLPVCVHTSNDGLSDPEQLLEVAKRHPQVNFVMVHMGLQTDNEAAIRCLRQSDNLFGDTTWVPYEKTRKALEILGGTKMVFGSDAPIDGDRSYTLYQEYLQDYVQHPTALLDRLMYRNARELFGL